MLLLFMPCYSTLSTGFKLSLLEGKALTFNLEEILAGTWSVDMLSSEIESSERSARSEAFFSLRAFLFDYGVILLKEVRIEVSTLASRSALVAASFLSIFGA